MRPAQVPQPSLGGQLGETSTNTAGCSSDRYGRVRSCRPPAVLGEPADHEHVGEDLVLRLRWAGGWSGLSGRWYITRVGLACWLYSGLGTGDSSGS